ncbi:N-acetylglucosamine-1-phosphodiester alpha-N-acetylglucosaminidase-like [Symphorus nematophorus]
MTLVRDPLRTLSVLEPGGPGGCEKRRSATAEQMAVAAGCLYAQKAGFFTGTSDRRLGNVVSDGRMVRDSGGQRNAQFGIRKDGSLVFGYLSQEDVLDRSNPFVQLVSGVVWLLRKGKIYINQSLKAEDVLSARTVVGHDADGNLILFHVDGKTKKRGTNLWEVADFLKKNGVIDAINLNGGGSSSFVINGTLASYPPDRCKSDSRWRCARDVSSVLCVHWRRCEPADCDGHGDCVNGRRRCQQGWRGAACDSLVCRPPACGPHGVCSANGCVCDAGWRGKNCSQGGDDDLESNCCSVAGSGQCEPAIPVDVQDSATKTITWLLQMVNTSDEDATANQPDCSPDVTVSAPPSESEVTVVPHAVCEILNASDPSVHIAQLPSPEPPAEHVTSQDASSPPSAAEAQQVPSPVHATVTQPDGEINLPVTKP